MSVLVTVTVILFSVAFANNKAPEAWLQPTTSFVGNPFVGGPWHYPACGKDFPDQSSLWIFAVKKPLDANVTLSISAFSSSDLCNWAAHDDILDMSGFPWANASLYAPTSIFRDGKYYLYFSATGYPPGSEMDGRATGNYSGIGVGVSDKPEGPYRNPLPNNTALIPADDPTITEPYGPAVLVDGTRVYMLYGSGGALELRELSDNMTSLSDEKRAMTTPPGHFLGVRTAKRGNIYYLLWNNIPLGQPSAGQPVGSIHYAISTKPEGPYLEGGIILTADSAVAHTVFYGDVINPLDDKWLLFYSRVQTLSDYPNTTVDGLAWEAMFFGDDGAIEPVPMRSYNTFQSEYKLNEENLPIGWLHPNASLAVKPSYSDGDTDRSYLELGTKGPLEVAHAMMLTNFSDVELDLVVSMNATMDTSSAGVIFRASINDNFEQWVGYLAEYLPNGSLVLGKMLPGKGTVDWLGRNDSFNKGEKEGSQQGKPKTPELPVPLRLRVRAEGDWVRVYRGDSPNNDPAISAHEKTWASGWTPGCSCPFGCGQVHQSYCYKIKSIVHAGFSLTDAGEAE